MLRVACLGALVGLAGSTWGAGAGAEGVAVEAVGAESVGVEAVGTNAAAITTWWAGAAGGRPVPARAGAPGRGAPAG